MPSRLRWPLYLAFACSGAAALVYETTWTRLLSLFMGHTVAAASSVLAAFMGGLAIGAGIAGRVAPRQTPSVALRSYAALEILIASLALAVPFEIVGLRPLLAAAYADGGGGAWFGLLRLASALLVVTLPAVAMGATLPLVVRWAVASAKDAGRDTARVYASNTLGATIGALGSGFLLLPALGTRGTTWVAVALNLVSAAIAIGLSRTAIASATVAGDARKAAAATVARTSASRSRAIPPAALAISGAVSLILQVTWTRILSLVIGPTTYAFSVMVAIFIAGIAVGSLVGGWLGRRGPAPGWLAVSLFASGAAAVVAAAWVPQVPLIVAGAAAAPEWSFDTFVRLQVTLVALLMLPMTVAFGASFPLAVGLAVRDDQRISTDVAMVYTANTLGAIGGALAGGFVLVPRLGLQGSVRAAVVLVIAAGALVGWTYAERLGRRLTVLGAAATAIIAVWLIPPWDRALLSSGAYKYAAYLPEDNRDFLLRAGRLLYYREGAAATVSVRRLAGSTSLAIDGKIDASNTGDMLTQRLLAHLPLLLHPNPRRVAIIGLGSGVTLGSALRHPVERVDTVEISPEVVEASAHFSRENGRALADPRSRLIVGDGRSHVTLGRAVYDVVISEPSNPWMAGVAGLFTREMFDGIRRRLSPGGVACQWAHAYDMSEADLRSIVATFTDVFPESSLWMIGESDVLLVGTTDRTEPGLSRIRAGWTRPGVSEDLAGVGVATPEVLLSLFTAHRTALRAFGAGADIQRDDRLALEFTGPRSIYGASGRAGVDVLASLATDADAPQIVKDARHAIAVRRDRGLMLLGTEAFTMAVSDLAAAVEHDPDDHVAMEALLRAAAPAGRLEEAERLLREISSRDTTRLGPMIGVSRILASRGQFVEAANVLPRSPEGKDDLRALEQLASVFADAGDADRLSDVVGRLQQSAPGRDATVYFSAVLAYLAGRPHDALRLAAPLRDRGTARARDWTLIGTVYATLAQRDEARRAFDLALRADPRDITGYLNLGAFELADGNFQVAAGHYAEALILDPSSPAARQGLSDARRGMR